MTERVSVPDVLAEIQSGDALSLAGAGRLFPGHRGAGTVNPCTVFRWATTGAKTPTGAKVKLEAVRVGGRWITSRGAVARFVGALTAAASPAATTVSIIRTSTSVSRAQCAAEKLKRMGA